MRSSAKQSTNRMEKSMKPALLSAGIASVLIASTAAAWADELPARKPGLWEVKTSIGDNGRSVTVQQCVDAATDQMLQSSAGPFSADLCQAREVKKSEGATTIDSRCTLGGTAGSAHAVVSGSFDSVYTMTVTSEGGGLPPVKMTIEGKWLGACATGQEPGDVTMPGGAKVNLPQLQKRARDSAGPLSPAK
jgi:Protein of unknown function (DUF3617)